MTSRAKIAKARVVSTDFELRNREASGSPTNPESHAIPSNRADSCGFQFEISDPAFLLVQKSVNLRPDYYMKYYTPPWGESAAALADRRSPRPLPAATHI